MSADYFLGLMYFRVHPKINFFLCYENPFHPCEEAKDWKWKEVNHRVLTVIETQRLVVLGSTALIIMVGQLRNAHP